MSTLHAVRNERRDLRIMQAKSVMPMIGPLIDAWDGASNDLKDAIRDEEPTLAEYLDKIAEEMESSIKVHED